MASLDKANVDSALKQVQMRKARYVTFKVESTDDKIQVVVDKISARNVTYKDFLKEFKDNKPLYASYDYEFKSADGRTTSALYFFAWMPANCNTNDRILYSSVKSNIVNALSGYKLFACEEEEELEEILQGEVIQSK